MEGGHCEGANVEENVPHLISNLAVLEMLQSRVDARKSGKSSSRQLQHRDWVERHVIEYLSSTATTQFQTAANAAALQKLLRSSKMTRTADGTATAGFDLTEAESLQIVNLSPTEPVEIHLLVEELHDRMTARKQEELLATIQSYRVAIPLANGSHAVAVANDVTMDDSNENDDRKPAAERKGA